MNGRARGARFALIFPPPFTTLGALRRRCGSGAFSCVVGAVPSGNEVCEHLNEHGFLPIATGEVDGVYKAFFYAEVGRWSWARRARALPL